MHKLMKKMTTQKQKSIGSVEPDFRGLETKETETSQDKEATSTAAIPTTTGVMETHLT